MTYTDVFGGSTVQPGDVQLRAVALSASIATVWPAFATANNQLARIMKVSASAGGLTITLPDALYGSVGQDALFDNTGANEFTVLDASGAPVATLTPGQVKYVYLSANPTLAGQWRVILFGVGASSPDASQLVGAGLKAIANTLNFSPLLTSISANTTVLQTDRARVFVWTGGSGTLTLPTTAGSSSDFVIEVRNQGTGTLAIAPVGGALIDASASIAMVVNESAFVHMGASDWYTIGRGRNTAFNFTRLSKAVTGGAVNLTLAEAANVVQNYTGTLLANQTVNLPGVVQVYYVSNNTSGAFALTFACTAGGTSVAVSPGQAAILFCDGINIINANTSLAGGITSLLFAAGSAGAPSVAIGSVGNGLYAPGSNQIGIATNGAAAVLIAASGVVTFPVPGTTLVAPVLGTPASGNLANCTNIPASTLVRSQRTSNTQLGPADIGKIIVFQGSIPFTQTFAPAATLGNGWWCYLRNGGDNNTDITLDPFGAELIDGLASFIQYFDEVRLVTCDGISLFSNVIAPFNKTFNGSATFVRPSRYSYFSGRQTADGGGGGTTGGGGGGGAIDFVIPKTAIGVTQAVTLGTGGAPGANGGNAVFATVTAYGGAAGASNGGGGGGAFGAGSGTVGGAPANTGYGGGLGGTAATGGDAGDGGGGGGGNGFAGGRSVKGGGGGGGTGGAAGGSLFGGAGGAPGNAGASPGGGGGANAAGAAGQLTITGS